MVLLGEEPKQEAPGNKGATRYQDKENPVLGELFSLDSRGRAHGHTGDLRPIHPVTPDHDTGLPAVWLHPHILPRHPYLDENP